MYTFITILISIVCILLVLVILIQSSKGGLSSGLSSSNQVMGVRKTTDFLEKITWSLAIALITLSVVANLFLPGGDAKQSDSMLQEKIDTAPIGGENLPISPLPQENSNPLKDS